LIAQEHIFGDGETIAEQGDLGDAMHIIVSGEVSIVVKEPERERTLALRSAGDVIGEMAVITSQPRMAALIAKGSVRLLTIGQRQFESILRERPETSLAVMRVLCQRIAERPPAMPSQ
jgi:CRP-like cAMP-binding protein